MKIYTFLILLMLVLSCKNTDKNTSIEADEKTEIEQKASEIIEKENPEKKKISTGITINLEQEVTQFKACKNNAVGRTDCRNAITKIISKRYGLTDFYDAKLGYKVYDSIRPVIERSKQWKSLGGVTQSSLEKALAHTNKGGLSLVIDTSQSYGHVVLLVSGSATPSGSWGMPLPNVLSLANHNPEKSFSNKSLAYALKKSGDLKVYLRK